MAPKCNHKGPHKKEAEGDFTQTHTHTHTRKQCDYRGRNWSDVATNQEIPAAAGSRRGKEPNSLELPGKCSPGDTLIWRQ